MKFDELRSIGHNIAASLASGDSLLTGVFGTDIFGEAGRSPEGFITVDFLRGTSAGGKPSAFLADAIVQCREAFVALCRNHGTSHTVFREATARYSCDVYGGRFLATVEDAQGRRKVDEYTGMPGSRAKVLDHFGRIRPK
jgi:hypothetical protein